MAKRSAGHLGCLVLNTFNVALRTQQGEASAASQVKEGDTVHIQVTRVDMGSGRNLPHIDGKLLRQGDEGYDSGIASPEQHFTFPDSVTGTKRPREDINNGEEEEASKGKKLKVENGDAVEKDIESVKSKKKKKKKDKEKEIELPNAEVKVEYPEADVAPEVVESKPVLNDADVSNEHTEDVGIKHKKKKKNKDNVSEETHVGSEYVEVGKPKKKKKKSKEESGEVVIKDEFNFSKEYVEPDDSVSLDQKAHKKKKKNKDKEFGE